MGIWKEVVSRANRSCFGSDLCFLPPSARRIFHCFRPCLSAFSDSGSKVGQPHNFQHCTEIFSSLATVLILVYPKEKSFIIPCKNKGCMLF